MLAPGPPRRPRALRRPAFLALLAFAAVAVTACPGDEQDPGRVPVAVRTSEEARGDPTRPPRELDEIEEGFALWRRERPDSYVMTLEYTCFCSNAGTWRVRVDGDRVTNAEVRDGEGDAAGDPPPTITTLYRSLLGSLERFPEGRVGLTVGERGVPERGSFDAPNADDEELNWTITRFAPR